MERGAEVRVWTQDTLIGEIVVVAGARGIRAITFADRAVAATSDATDAPEDAVARQLDDWFAGRRHDLDVDLDLEGVEGFRRQVLETLVKEVGWGETVSYGELAEMAGSPGAARAVGTIMAGNPIPFVIPCHRVIASGGRIGGYGGTAARASHNLDIKRMLLAREGVVVRG